MAKKAGRTISLTASRRLVGDLLHFARQVPSVPVQRQMRLAALVEARARAPHHVSWCAIFTKAFARTAALTPELRRAFLPFPWGRLYEHPHSVATIAVERVYQGENVVLYGHLTAPERKTLLTLDERLRLYKTESVESEVLFRRALAIGRLPGFLRRSLWWSVLNVSGHWRACFAGTFGVTVYSGLGAESLHPLSPLTATLNYGVIQGDGSVVVRVIYDHRVLDGPTVARALARMEEVLLQEVLPELTGADPGARRELETQGGNGSQPVVLSPGAAAPGA